MIFCKLVSDSVSRGLRFLYHGWPQLFLRWKVIQAVKRKHLKKKNIIKIICIHSDKVMGIIKIEQIIDTAYSNFIDNFDSVWYTFPVTFILALIQSTNIY